MEILQATDGISYGCYKGVIVFCMVSSFRFIVCRAMGCMGDASRLGPIRDPESKDPVLWVQGCWLCPESPISLN